MHLNVKSIICKMCIIEITGAECTLASVTGRSLQNYGCYGYFTILTMLNYLVVLSSLPVGPCDQLIALKFEFNSAASLFK